MDFGTAVVFLFLYFIRPQDWLPGIEGLNVVKPLMAFGLFALLTRPQGFAPQGMRSIMRTPHDWIMVVYSLYILYTAPEFGEAFSEVVPLISFYFLTTLSLDTPERMEKYLKWWMIFLVSVAALAVGSLVGIDFTGARGVTEQNQGRLCLNTWMLDNPNALGHTVAAAMPLLYFMLCWKRPAAKKLLAAGLALLCFFCIYKTESKGAYIAGFAALVTALLFGRPRSVQILSAILIVVLGTSLLKFLPRMQDVSGIRSDEGVQGRVLAWGMAKVSYEGHTTGEGFKQFIALIPWEGEMIPKPPHSSYIQVAADLGAPGLFIYLLVFAAGVHTLTRIKGSTESMERSRRVLFAILLAFMISSWMIQRPYHAEFFVMMAAISSYHNMEARQRQRQIAVEAELNEPGHRAAAAVSPAPAGTGGAALPDPNPYAAPRPEPEPAQAWRPPHLAGRTFREQRGKRRSLKPIWRRPVLAEFAFALLLYQGVMVTWDYVINNF